jgi:HNH endonuclease
MFHKGMIPWNKDIVGVLKPNKTSFKKGIIPANYKGGVCFFTRDNRWVIYCKDNSKVHFARAVMEAHLKRILSSNDIIHHKNEDSTDDRIENLEVLSRAEHINFHRKELLKARRKRWLSRQGTQSK